jgi:hypothetical protein
MLAEGQKELIGPARLPVLERKIGRRAGLALGFAEKAIEHELTPAFVAGAHPL